MCLQIRSIKLPLQQFQNVCPPKCELQWLLLLFLCQVFSEQKLGPLEWDIPLLVRNLPESHQELSWLTRWENLFRLLISLVVTLKMQILWLHLMWAPSFLSILWRRFLLFRSSFCIIFFFVLKFNQYSIYLYHIHNTMFNINIYLYLSQSIILYNVFISLVQWIEWMNSIYSIFSR